MTELELRSPLKPRDDDDQRFAEDLADDLQGTAVEVVHVMVEDQYYLARVRDDD